MLKGMENARPIINNNTQIIQKLKLVPTDLVKPFPQAVIEDGHETYTYDHFLNTRLQKILILIETKGYLESL
jgi:outer membrane lipoprotein-sorting protein